MQFLSALPWFSVATCIPILTAKLSEVVLSFELPKGKCFILSTLVSPSTCCSMQCTVMHIKCLLNNWIFGLASITFWKSTVCREKTDLRRKKTKVQGHCWKLFNTLKALCREGPGGAVFPHLWISSSQYHVVWGGPKCTPTTTDFSHSLYCQWLKCLTFKLIGSFDLISNL